MSINKWTLLFIGLVLRYQLLNSINSAAEIAEEFGVQKTWTRNVWLYSESSEMATRMQASVNALVLSERHLNVAVIAILRHCRKYVPENFLGVSSPEEKDALLRSGNRVKDLRTDAAQRACVQGHPGKRVIQQRIAFCLRKRGKPAPGERHLTLNFGGAYTAQFLPYRDRSTWTITGYSSFAGARSGFLFDDPAFGTHSEADPERSVTQCDKAVFGWPSLMKADSYGVRRVVKTLAQKAHHGLQHDCPYDDVGVKAIIKSPAMVSKMDAPKMMSGLKPLSKRAIPVDGRSYGGRKIATDTVVETGKAHISGYGPVGRPGKNSLEQDPAGLPVKSSFKARMGTKILMDALGSLARFWQFMALNMDTRTSAGELKPALQGHFLARNIEDPRRTQVVLERVQNARSPRQDYKLPAVIDDLSVTTRSFNSIHALYGARRMREPALGSHQDRFS